VGTSNQEATIGPITVNIEDLSDLASTIDSNVEIKDKLSFGIRWNVA
jgi:hypothetical protein